ncbi:MAG: type I-C CRISPR-associated endonuclease Cas1 [Clostridia bacterium]|nr:type I-C CRISPR-associated endonuclease Cas1 [Clostridia bacterium]
MKQLLNTLYVTSEDIYLSLDGENILANRAGQTVARYPLHTLQSIITFSYAGASPALMGACAERNISLAFCTPYGKFLARVGGETSGNVLLRRKQYRVADDPAESCEIAKNMILGKVYNAQHSIERTRRDHGMRIDAEKLAAASDQLKESFASIMECTALDSLRGLEGAAATVYFGVLDEMILNQKDVFTFHGRSRRPPLDPMNAMLSFAYSLLGHDCAAALESVGLDSYVGFMHRDRPGRSSLALDLMEELRPCMADRFVLTLINNRIIRESDFEYQATGAVLLNDTGRKTFLKNWQEKKKDTLTHPFLGEKMVWGMVPYLQAMLLARYLRGDLDAYPPFLWK